MIILRSISDSEQQLSALRTSLEDAARANHSEILSAREKQIKEEAETLHRTSMQQEQQRGCIVQLPLPNQGPLAVRQCFAHVPLVRKACLSAYIGDAVVGSVALKRL